MRLIKAKNLGSTHLELGQPIPAQPGEHIVISVPDEKDEDRLWRTAAKKHFLAAYDAQDAIYDGLGDFDGSGEANEPRAN